MTSLRLVTVLLLLVAGVVLAAGCIAGNNPPVIEIPGSTTVIAANVTSLHDLEMKGIFRPSLSVLLPAVSRYDVVTFDYRTIGQKIQSGQDLMIRVRGKEYRARLHPLSSDGEYHSFTSYSGSLSDDLNSSILLTICPGFIVGSVTVNGENFRIMPVDKEAWSEDSAPVLHVIYNIRDAPGYPDPAMTDIAPSEEYLHYYRYDNRSGITHLTRPTLIGMENPATDGDRIVWSWVYYEKRGLTLYTISTGNYTEIPADPFGLSPPKISGDYLVWADSTECLSPGQTNGLVLYNITSETRTCLGKNPKSPRYAAISGNYVVWEDNNHRERDVQDRLSGNHYLYDIYLYDIRTGNESVILPNLSSQEYPSVSGDWIVWSDSRNYPASGYFKDIYLYNIADGSVTVINPAPVPATASAPHIFQNYVLWSDTGKGSSSRVHLYDIPLQTERILDDSSSGDVIYFSGSGNFVVWTSLEFRGSDIPESQGMLFDMKNGGFVPACQNESSPIAIAGNIILVFDSGGFGFCQVPS
jgi:hypothetical protein